MITEKEINDTNEKYEELNKLTQQQDSLNLSITSLNESIAISKSISDRANAILLEVSRWRGDLKPLIEHGYLFEKVNSLINDYNALAHDYVITHGNPATIFSCAHEKEETKVPKDIMKMNIKEIFRNIRFNPAINKLEKVL